MIQTLTLLLMLITATVSAWNAYQNQKMGRVIAELQLNMRREMNGRYVTIDRFEDFKHYVEREVDHGA